MFENYWQEYEKFEISTFNSYQLTQFKNLFK